MLKLKEKEESDESVLAVDMSLFDLPSLPEPGLQLLSINWADGNRFEIIADLPAAACNATCEVDQAGRQVIVKFDIRKRKAFVPENEDDQLAEANTCRCTIAVPQLNPAVSWKLNNGFQANSGAFKWIAEKTNLISGVTLRRNVST
jgi:hypothetical protein